MGTQLFSFITSELEIYHHFISGSCLCILSTFTYFTSPDPHNSPLHKEDKYSYWGRGKAGRSISRNSSPDGHQRLPIPHSAQTEAIFDCENYRGRSFYSNKLLHLHDVIQVCKTVWGYIHVWLMTSTTPGNFNLRRWRYRLNIWSSHSETSKTGED